MKAWPVAWMAGCGRISHSDYFRVVAVIVTAVVIKVFRESLSSLINNYTTSSSSMYSIRTSSSLGA